jgi:hypothetical protein
MAAGKDFGRLDLQAAANFAAAAENAGVRRILEYLVRLPEIAQAAGEIFDAAGPETLTYEEMMRNLADVVGKHHPLIVPVSVLSPKFSFIPNTGQGKYSPASASRCSLLFYSL